MSMNSVPFGERLHIGIFGKRNAGKSSVMNALTGQRLSIVSPVEGTTTDPVQKAMELLPLGPVVLMDTPGIDDEGALGKLRVEKTYQMLNRSDLALLVIDIRKGFSRAEEELLEKILEKNIPCAVVLNQTDLAAEREVEAALLTADERIRQISRKAGKGEATADSRVRRIPVSAAEGSGIEELKELLAALGKEKEPEKRLAADLLIPGKLTLLVVPVDKAAPKGRLILPQQQTIRDILEAGCAALVVRDTELEETIRKYGDEVGLVITDSQVFGMAAKVVPEEIPLTSFSILFARYKGELEPLAAGVQAVARLQDEDRVLISEGCTHHRQCNDIGTVKIPGWLEEYTGKKLQFTFSSGGEFPQNLDGISLIIHCGGCMLNEKEMKHRIACAKEAQVPITNYGMFISYTKGILERSLRPIPGCEHLLS